MLTPIQPRWTFPGANTDSTPIQHKRVPVLDSCWIGIEHSSVNTWNDLTPKFNSGVDTNSTQVALWVVYLRRETENWLDGWIQEARRTFWVYSAYLYDLFYFQSIMIICSNLILKVPKNKIWDFKWVQNTLKHENLVNDMTKIQLKYAIWSRCSSDCSELLRRANERSPSAAQVHISA